MSQIVQTAAQRLFLLPPVGVSPASSLRQVHSVSVTVVSIKELQKFLVSMVSVDFDQFQSHDPASFSSCDKFSFGCCCVPAFRIK